MHRGGPEIRVRRGLKASVQVGTFDARLAFQRLLPFDVAAIWIDHSADGDTLEPGLFEERQHLFRQQAIVIEERVTIKRGLARLGDGEMFEEGTAIVRMVQMIAMVENMRGDPARAQDTAAFPQEGGESVRTVVLQRAAGVTQIEGVRRQRYPVGSNTAQRSSSDRCDRRCGSLCPAQPFQKCAALGRDRRRWKRGRQRAVDSVR